MFRQPKDDTAKIAALNAAQAVIEFTPDGKILTANDNFASLMGYRRDELVGQHHRIFCETAFTESSDYRLFWQRLADGQCQSNAFKRLAKDGRMVWLQATYSPVFDGHGKVTSVIKFALDITDVKSRELDFSGKIAALDRAQAIIEFKPGGEILTANENFLAVMGYRLDEIVGRHHRMFCDADYIRSTEYLQFWEKLGSGEVIAEEFRRVGKNGKRVYIQASYNPIVDNSGRIVKIVKFATDVTAAVQRRLDNDQTGRDIGGQLTGVLAEMSDAARLANGASSASAQTSSIVDTVAAAAEELSASVREIAENMTAARASVEGVFKHAEAANEFASTLSRSAEAMTSVVDVIQGIASQINLLALNATIESARAGDAGKGFAVVASEVKSLANQASSSTKTIGAEINRIQAVSREVVASLNVISGSMTHVLANVTSVAGAIDEQHSVTGEISQNMQSAVIAVHEIEDSLTQINTAFGAVVSASEGVKVNVEKLVA